jgi:hypothetical protein
MLEGLRTAIYHVGDLERAKGWCGEVLGKESYFDEPFYVGFDVGGFELGLQPDEGDAEMLAEGAQRPKSRSATTRPATTPTWWTASYDTSPSDAIETPNRGRDLLKCVLPGRGSARA